jgi:hypothetical protein
MPLLNKQGKVVDNYIVRIYRRRENDPRILVGVVEEVGVGGNKAFTNLDELWSILNSKKSETTKGKKQKKPDNHKDSLRNTPIKGEYQKV